MEFYEVIAKRRTIRDFADTPVKRETLYQILEAGVKAPTYNHLREWDFILIDDQTIRLQIVEAEKLPDTFDVEGLRETFQKHDPPAQAMYLEAIPKQKRMLLTAPVLLVVIYTPKTPIAQSTRVYDLNGLASVWCCIENILLAMAAEGLYGVTYIPQHTDAIKTVLKVPETLEIAAIIPIGFPAKHAKTVPQKDVDLSRKLHQNTW
jgi:nitroreductase